VEESIAEALDFRRAMRKVDAEMETDGAPTGGSRSGVRWNCPRKAWAARRLDAAGRRALARLRPAGPGFNLLDPIKATIITPGLDVDGDFADWGIPAAILTKYLAEHGVIVEKTGLYSFFIMFTIGITKGRWNTMVTELQQFKDDYDRNQPLWRIMPDFVAKHPQYERIGLKDLCSKSTRSTRPTTWPA
jgi:arginine decarboxylase